MKRLAVCFCLFAITTLISACGKTEFSSSDASSVLKAEENGEANGQLLQEVIDDPALAQLHQCGNKKVYVCHVPPGNPEAAHTICISINAIPAHLDHQAATGEEDTLGECEKRRCNSQESGREPLIINRE